MEFNKENQTPLRIAAENNSKEKVELLISKGADVNIKDLINLTIQIILLIKII